MKAEKRGGESHLCAGLMAAKGNFQAKVCEEDVRPDSGTAEVKSMQLKAWNYKFFTVLYLICLRGYRSYTTHMDADDTGIEQFGGIYDDVTCA